MSDTETKEMLREILKLVNNKKTKKEKSTKQFGSGSIIEAWGFLYYHPYYARIIEVEKLPFNDVGINDRYIFRSGFEQSLSAFPTKVNPITKEVMEDTRLNTESMVWLESGHWYFGDYEDSISSFNHDIKLDVGAKTWEKAIIKLANKVFKIYGDFSIPDYFEVIEPNLDKWLKIVGKDD